MNFTSINRVLFLALTLDLGLWTLDTRAQSVPSLINYQGRLSDSNGAALPTADYQLTFRIYDTNSAGNLIWGPQIFDGVVGTNGHGLRIPVVQGYFNVMLGPTDVSNRDLAISFNGTNRFVEVQVSTNTAISPRHWIVAAPYALNSLKLAGADWSAVFGTNDPVNGKIPGFKVSDPFTVNNLNVQAAAHLTWSQYDGTDRWLFLGYNGETNSHHTLILSDQPSGNTAGGLFVSGLTVADSYGYGYPGLNNLLVKGAIAIGKTNPATALDVNGTVTATNFSGSGSGLTGIALTNMTAPNLAYSAVVTSPDANYPSEAAVSGLQVTLVGSGRPVTLFFMSGASSAAGHSDFEVDNPPDAVVSVYRGTTLVGAERVQLGAASPGSLIVPTSSLRFFDLTPPAGTNSYTVKLWSNGGSSHPFFHSVRFAAMEL